MKDQPPLRTIVSYQKQITLKPVGLQYYAQIWTNKRSKLHARENARATLHPNKETFKLKKPQL